MHFLTLSLTITNRYFFFFWFTFSMFFLGIWCCDSCIFGIDMLTCNSFWPLSKTEQTNGCNWDVSLFKKYQDVFYLFIFFLSSISFILLCISAIFCFFYSLCNCEQTSSTSCIVLFLSLNTVCTKNALCYLLK